jgi:poly(3-hydroxybutyrate) depolymerase
VRRCAGGRGWTLPALAVAVVLLAGCGERSVSPAPYGLEPGLHLEAGLQEVAVELPGGGGSRRVLVYLPSGARPETRMAAVLYLHGGSQRGDDLRLLEGYGPPRLAAKGAQLPFILIAPQLPPDEIWDDSDTLLGLVDELASRYPIDPDRLYVTGTSMGGRGAWYLASRHPERFAAVAPVAAHQPEPGWLAGGRLGRLPVRAYHGSRDEIAPFSDAVRMHEALLDAGGRSELVVLPDRDHFVAEVLEDEDLYEWLLRHRLSDRITPPGPAAAPRSTREPDPGLPGSPPT